MQMFDNITGWIIIGFIGQFVFSIRFILQWIASERVKQSIIPEAFWYCSLIGGMILFSYAWHKQDPVFILGQGLGVFIYLRNIYFVRKKAKADKKSARPAIED